MHEPRQHQTCVVYAKQKWQEEWGEVAEGLYCDTFTEVAGPDVAEATLRYNFGQIEGTDGQVTLRTTLVGNGWYVRIVLTQYTADDDFTVRYWYGVIVDTTIDRKGRLSSTSGDAPSGQQIFHCRGLDFLLQRCEVDSSFVLNAAGEEIEIGRAIGFNLGAGRANDHVRHGNRSETFGERDAHIFADVLPVGGVVTEGSGNLWSVHDIIVYLFHYQPPRDIFGADRLNWTVPDGEDAVLLTKLFPTVQAHGKTIKAILDEIIDRRRLVGYTIIVQGDDDKPKLNIFTFNKTAVALPGGATVPANTHQFTWYFDDDAVVTSAIMSEDDAPRFDVVIVRGAPLGACITIASTDGATPYNDLVKDWNDELVTRLPADGYSYNYGASDAAAYADLMSIDRAAANQAFRANEIFAKVFRSFIIDPEWDGTVGGTAPACPDPNYEDEEGNPSTTHISPFWYPGLRLLDWLPLRTDYDYETVEDFETTSLTIESSQPNYLRPFAVAKIGDVYYRLDRPGKGIITDDLLKNNGIYFAASIRMQDNCPGLFIDVQGAAQHVIAKDEFVPADPDDENDEESVIDWKDIACTIFVEFDQHVEARMPPEPLDTEADVVRELIIEQPQYRLDYLAPETVLGVDNEGELLTSDGGYVRDDRAIMQDIARCAFEWYGAARRAMTIVRHDLVCDYNIGDLITFVGTSSAPVTANTVVTKIVFDILNMSVAVHTQYAELDPRVA